MPLIAQQFEFLNECIKFFEDKMKSVLTSSIFDIDTKKFADSCNDMVAWRNALQQMFDNQISPSVEEINTLKSAVTETLTQFIAIFQAIETNKAAIIAKLTSWQQHVSLRVVAHGDSPTAENAKHFLWQVRNWKTYFEQGGFRASELLKLAKAAEIEWPQSLSRIESAVAMTEGPDAKKFEFVQGTKDSKPEFKKFHVRSAGVPQGVEYIEIQTLNDTGNVARTVLADYYVSANAGRQLEAAKFAELKVIIQKGNLDLLKPYTDLILESFPTPVLTLPATHLDAHREKLRSLGYSVPSIYADKPFQEIDKLIATWSKALPSYRVVYFYSNYHMSQMDEVVFNLSGPCYGDGRARWEVHFEPCGFWRDGWSLPVGHSKHTVAVAMVPMADLAISPKNDLYLTRVLLRHEYLGMIAITGERSTQTLLSITPRYEGLLRAMLQVPYDATLVDEEFKSVVEQRAARVAPLSALIGDEEAMRAAVSSGGSGGSEKNQKCYASASGGSGGMHGHLTKLARTASNQEAASFHTLAAILNLKVVTAAAEHNPMQYALNALARENPGALTTFEGAELPGICWILVLDYTEEAITGLLQRYIDSNPQGRLIVTTRIAPYASFLTGAAAATGAGSTTAAGEEPKPAAISMRVGKS